MTSILPSTKPQQTSPKSTWLRRSRYLILGVVSNVMIWGITLVYLQKTAPTYTSGFSLILPTGTSGVSVNLPEIGQATASSGSPFGSTTSDPRENYKYIATSEPVLQAAANRLDLPMQKFGQPRIKLLNNTTIMELEISGGSPEQAQKKAWQLYYAMVDRLTNLRDGEIGEREKVTQSALKASRIKLEEAQKKLSDYKAKSGLISPEQVRNLANNIELLRKLKVETVTQQQQASSQLRQLATTLRINPDQASDAFLLQVDQPFQEILKNYKEATANLVVYQSKWGENHPMVKTEKARQLATAKALVDRGKILLGHTLNQAQLNQLNLDGNGGGVRATLFQQLISASAEQQGLNGQVAALNQQIQQLEIQLADLAQKQAVFDRLNRDLQVSEAVFASTLAKSDLRKGDIFGSYPLIQILKEPNLPESPTAPKKGLVYAGAMAGSILCATGLALMWSRQKLVQAYSRLHRAKVASQPSPVPPDSPPTDPLLPAPLPDASLPRDPFAYPPFLVDPLASDPFPHDPFAYPPFTVFPPERHEELV